MQKILLRAVGFAGVLIFGAFLYLTFSTPEWVEDYAAKFVDNEVSKQIDQTIDNLQPPEGDSAISRMANALLTKNQERIDQLKSNLKNGVHELMADAMAEIRDLDCECRDKWADFIKKGFKFEIALLQTANDKIVDLIQSKYMEVVNELKRDIRIFTTTNAAVFLAVLLVSFLKPRAVAHLFLPASLLVMSTAVCSYFYIFQQNWLLTIIYGNYTGYMYLGYLFAVFMILCDIVFNKARVTTNVINVLLNVMGSVASVNPC